MKISYSTSLICKSNHVASQELMYIHQHRESRQKSIDPVVLRICNLVLQDWLKASGIMRITLKGQLLSDQLLGVSLIGVIFGGFNLKHYVQLHFNQV